MKSWLLKFRISSALNEREPMPPALEREINRSEDARRFAEASGVLGKVLKNQLPKPEVSEAAHASIMRAVRVAAQSTRGERQSAALRWIPVGGLALVALMGVLWATQFHHAPVNGVNLGNSRALSAAGSALELGGGIVSAAPAAVMSPLADEIQHLDGDLVSTAKFLMASLP